MKRSLTEWLEKIGEEIFVEGAHPDGTIISRSNDEQLARLIWDRALGQQIQTEHEDGRISVDVMKPDPKAQAFIIERREGKFVTPTEDRSLTPLDRIDEMVRDQVNDAAKAAVDDDCDPDNSDPNDEAAGTVSEGSGSMDRSDYESDDPEEPAS